MPHGLKPDATLARIIKGYYLEAAEARAPRETAWDESYKRCDPSYVDKTKVRGPFFVKVPYCYRTLENETGALMEASDANGKWVICRATTREYGNVSHIVEQAINNEFQFQSPDLFDNNEQALETIGNMGMKYGNADALVEYEEGEDYSGCRVIPLDPYATFRDWKHGRWFLIHRVVTLGEFATIAESLSAPLTKEQQDPLTGETVVVDLGPRDGGRAKKVFETVKAAITSGMASGSNPYLDAYAKNSRQRQADMNRVAGDDTGINDGQVSPSDDPYNARLVILDYHETGKDGMVAQVIPCFGPGGDDLILCAEKNPYKVCRVIPWIPRRVDNEQYGLGIGEVVGPTSEAMDVCYRATLGYVVRVGNPAVLFRKGLRLRSEYLRSQSGISIPVEDTVNDIRYMEPAPNAGMWQMGFGFAKSVADLGTGMNDIKRATGGGSDSATEAAIMEAQGGLTDRRIFRRWRQFISQIGFVMLQIMRVRITRDRAIPILGRKTDLFLTLKPEYLKGTYAIQFGGNVSGQSAMQRQMQYRGIATTYGPAGAVDINELARADIAEMGHGDPDQFLTQKHAPESVSPRHEHIALFTFAQEPEVSPKDDHMAHLVAHMKEAQAHAGDPRVAALAQHMQIHQQVLVMQMQMQTQQAASAPQGPEPFQPGQAGQPGQPRAFSPAVADINRQRQASNERANGAAPGPVAPNRNPGQLMNGGMMRRG